MKFLILFMQCLLVCHARMSCVSPSILHFVAPHTLLYMHTNKTCERIEF